MNKYGKILTTLGVATALTAGYIWGIPAVVNLPSHKNYLEQKIFEQTGIKTDIGHPELSMGMFPSSRNFRRYCS